jgi:hypothetical protein
MEHVSLEGDCHFDKIPSESDSTVIMPTNSTMHDSITQGSWLTPTEHGDNTTESVLMTPFVYNSTTSFMESDNDALPSFSTPYMYMPTVFSMNKSIHIDEVTDQNGTISNLPHWIEVEKYLVVAVLIILSLY